MQDKPIRIPRLHVDAPLRSGETLSLPAEAAHHSAKVLRQRVGDPLALFDGRGGEYEATIASVERNKVKVEVGTWHAVERESPLAVVLAQGISSGERMDFTVQKAVELGVTAIAPLICEKSVVRLSAERAAARAAHWRRVAIAACEQCGRNRIPEISEPLSVARYCSQTTRSLDALQNASRLLLAPDAAIGFKVAAEALGEAVILAIGPESGFTGAEEDMLARAGFTAVRIGPRILRTETAALAALAALNGLRGDF